MIHSDEDLSKYNLVHEFNLLNKKLNVDENDLIIIIVEMPSVAKNAIGAVMDRTQYCLTGIPAETRIPNHVTATSSYARPLSGAHRMYPETDIATICIDEYYLTDIKKDMPETLESKKERFLTDLRLNEELAQTIISSAYLSSFEEIVKKYPKLEPKDIANFFINTLADLKKREKLDINKLKKTDVDDIFKNLSTGNLLKETIPQFVKIKLDHPELFSDGHFYP